MDKGKRLSYIDSYKKFKASRICVQWCIITGSLIFFIFFNIIFGPKGLTRLLTLYSVTYIEVFHRSKFCISYNIDFTNTCSLNCVQKLKKKKRKRSMSISNDVLCVALLQSKVSSTVE